MKVVPHTGLLWLFLSQPTGGDEGYGVLRKPWSDSVSAVRDEAELPITTARGKSLRMHSDKISVSFYLPRARKLILVKIRSVHSLWLFGPHLQPLSCFSSCNKLPVGNFVPNGLNSLPQKNSHTPVRMKKNNTPTVINDESAQNRVVTCRLG